MPRAISLVVATLNRAEALAEMLRSLSACSHPDGVIVELVLVDNGSTDHTAKVVGDFKPASWLSIDYQVETKRGVSAARNAGLRRARGDVIAILDDDVVVPEDYLERLVSEFADVSVPQLVGGRVELWDPTDQPFTIKTSREPAVLASDQHPGGFIHGCNMALSRRALDLIGYFDEDLGAGTPACAGEDTDFCHRAVSAGVTVRYAPELMVHHHHGRKSEVEILRLFRGYHIGNGALYTKALLSGDWRMLRFFWWSVVSSWGTKIDRRDFRRFLGRHRRARYYLLGMVRYVRQRFLGA